MRHFLTLAVGAAFGLAPALGLAAPNQMPSNPATSGQTAVPAAPDTATISKAGAALHDVALLQENIRAR